MDGTGNTVETYKSYTSRDMVKWQDNIATVARDMGCCLEEDRNITLRAPNVDCGARLLIAVICWVHAGGSLAGGQSFTTAMQETTKYESVTVTGILHLAHLLQRGTFWVEMYVVTHYCPGNSQTTTFI